jgi:hypothetical protein
VTRFQRQAFRHETPDAAQVQERSELAAVAEGAGRRQHGIAQRDAAQVDTGIHLLGRQRRRPRIARSVHASPSQ